MRLMFKHRAGLLLLLALCLGQTGCKKKPDTDALRAAEDKAWRERQRLQAIKYYSELVKNFPDSPNVEEAKSRLDSLGPVPTPARK